MNNEGIRIGLSWVTHYSPGTNLIPDAAIIQQVIGFAFLWLFSPIRIPMQQGSSIFDHDFLQETSIRRRSLMTLALKIFVWYFMVVSVLSLLSTVYFYFLPAFSFKFDFSDALSLLTFISGLFFIALTFLSSLFILLEKKWAILFALIVTGLSIIFRSYAFYKILNYTEASMNSTIMGIGWFLIRIPYLIILLKVKRPWETTAVGPKGL